SRARRRTGAPVQLSPVLISAITASRSHWWSPRRWSRLRRRLTGGKRGTQRRLASHRQEHVGLARREFLIAFVIAIDIRCLDIIECKVAALLIAKFGHPPEEIFIMWSFSRLHTDKADAQHLVLLRPCRDRPSRRAADQRHEIASCHSITSSARASTVGGISRPSAFAVLRLITSSYLVGAWTGRSAGFSPLRMRST